MANFPDNLKDSIDRYVQHGIPTGGFLQACIENDLHQAVARGDKFNVCFLPEIVRYLYNECPAGCWGFKGAMKEWQERLKAEQQEVEQ